MNESGLTPVLAPLQRVMLGDSLAREGEGNHVEQVEIRFSPMVESGRVISAWNGTVARTATLRIAFLIEGSQPSGWEEVSPPLLSIGDELLPGCWETWLEEDRIHLLLSSHVAPWRAVFWPARGLFVWTFHHALLDGRSITRVVRAFLDRVEGLPAEDLPLSRWQAPDGETKAVADDWFRRMFRPDVNSGTIGPGDPPADVSAVRFLGQDFLRRLEALARDLEVTVPTILIWAWGQAVIEVSGGKAAIVEQVRAGAPQPGTAGFTMALLPLMIAQGNAADLRDLHGQLHDLRLIESMSPDDFSPGVFPDVDGPWGSVIMVEHGTMKHLIGKRECVESITLHEAKGGTLMATAFLQPDLRLEVEGPGRVDLLEAWIEVLGWLARGVYPA